MSPGPRLVLALVTVLAAAPERARAEALTLLSEARHLGTAGEPEWEEFAGRRPHGKELALAFRAPANPGEWTLVVVQRDVKQPWRVSLNGVAIGQLHPQEVPTICALAVPAGALKDGNNVLAIGPPRSRDDVLVGPIRLERRALEATVGEATLALAVSEPGAGPIPARVTVVAEGDLLPPLLAAPGERLAVRPGVVYMPAGRARVRLPAGRYTLFAGRGFEYGVDSRRVDIAPGQTQAVSLAVRREVPTPGLVAADTHVHTVSFSKHGDATDDERAITLAGEGIELPIATEHNQHASYAAATARLGLGRRYTAVPGNEVTTPAGHFNVFPIASTAAAPVNAKLTDWQALLPAIRATPGVGVVILNHPRSVHSDFVPFGPGELDAVTGTPRRGRPFGFDAIELVNSGALQSDPMLVYRDWFALLNHGHRIAGVGASDSHDVNRFIVGQGRTYVACRDSDPGRIDVGAAVRSFREGRLLVSMGLLVRLTVDGRYGPGDLATRLGPKVRVEATVLGPSWARADRLELFANGVKLREEALEDPGRGGEKARRLWILPRPAADTHLVAIATGPCTTGLHWPIPRPYQPSSPAWKPRVMASTNPIWIDADRDGRFTPPRQTAARLIEGARGDVARLVAELGRLGDEAVALQAAALLRAAGRAPAPGGPEGLGAALAGAPEAVRRGFAAVADAPAPPP